MTIPKFWKAAGVSLGVVRGVCFIVGVVFCVLLLCGSETQLFNEATGGTLHRIPKLQSVCVVLVIFWVVGVVGEGVGVAGFLTEHRVLIRTLLIATIALTVLYIIIATVIAVFVIMSAEGKNNFNEYYWNFLDGSQADSMQKKQVCCGLENSSDYGGKLKKWFEKEYSDNKGEVKGQYPASCFQGKDGRGLLILTGCENLIKRDVWRLWIVSLASSLTAFLLSLGILLLSIAFMHTHKKQNRTKKVAAKDMNNQPIYNTEENKTPKSNKNKKRKI